MNIRRLEVTDYHRGYLNLLEQLTDVYGGQPIAFDDFKNQFDRLNSHIYIIEHNDKIVASGTLLIEYKFIHHLGSIGHIEDIVVDRNTRGMGFGRKIVSYLIDKAKEEGCYKVILDCLDKCQGFYEKCGMERKGIFMAKYY